MQTYNIGSGISSMGPGILFGIWMSPVREQSNKSSSVVHTHVAQLRFDCGRILAKATISTVKLPVILLSINKTTTGNSNSRLGTGLGNEGLGHCISEGWLGFLFLMLPSGGKSEDKAVVLQMVLRTAWKTTPRYDLTDTSRLWSDRQFPVQAY